MNSTKELFPQLMQSQRGAAPQKNPLHSTNTTNPPHHYAYASARFLPSTDLAPPTTAAAAAYYLSTYA